MVDLLIIGKNGQLGSSFVNIAKKRKIRYKAFSHRELDITKKKDLLQILTIKPKIVINTSAYHVLSECEANPQLAYLVNATAVAALAKVSKEIGAKYITYSTNYIFDGMKNKPYNESDKPNPLQMYGLSKLAGEYAAINTYKSGTYIIRTCGVYGKGYKGSRSKQGNYILRILNEAKKNKAIFASKKQIANPTYAIDLAIATLDLLEFKAPSGIYHLANEGAYSWYDFAKKILAIKKINIAIEAREDETNYQRPIYSVLGNYKSSNYGIKIPSIDDGLKRYLNEL